LADETKRLRTSFFITSRKNISLLVVIHVKLKSVIYSITNQTKRAGQYSVAKELTLKQHQAFHDPRQGRANFGKMEQIGTMCVAKNNMQKSALANNH